MSKIISANRLADGIVVYAGRDGSWSGRLSEAKVFVSQAEVEAGLLLAQNDAKRNLVVEPCVVDVIEGASGLRAVTLRETIRARGPTIDFLPRMQAFPPPGNGPKPTTKALLRIPRSEDAREHELMAGSRDDIAR
jgi:hypothetical protein